MSRILSTPAFPPFIPPVNRPVQQGQGNQNQNLFALLSFMNQQQSRDEDRAFRRDTADRQLRLAEDAAQDRNVDRNFRQMEQRLTNTQKALTKKGERAKEDHLKTNFFDPYDSAFRKMNSIVDPFAQQMTRTKNPNPRLALQKAKRLINVLDSTLGDQFNRGGFHSYGAVSGTHNSLQRLVFHVPEAVETEEFRTLAAKLQNPEVSKKNIPPSEMRQFALNSDEFRPVKESINDQVVAAQRNVTDPFVNVDPNPASIRALNKTFRRVESEFNPIASSVPPASPGSTSEPFRFSPGLSSQETSSLSRPSTPQERIEERTAAQADRVAQRANQLGPDPSAIGVLSSDVSGGIETVTTGAANLMDQVLGVKASTVQDFFRSPFGAVGTATEGPLQPEGFFSLSALLGRPRQPTLQGISAESESRTRSSPPLQIGAGILPDQSGPPNMNFLDEFLRQAQGLPPLHEQNEAEKLFSLINR